MYCCMLTLLPPNGRRVRMSSRCAACTGEKLRENKQAYIRTDDFFPNGQTSQKTSRRSITFIIISYPCLSSFDPLILPRWKGGTGLLQRAAPALAHTLHEHWTPGRTRYVVFHVVRPLFEASFLRREMAPCDTTRSDVNARLVPDSFISSCCQHANACGCLATIQQLFSDCSGISRWKASPRMT